MRSNNWKATSMVRS